MTRNFTMKGSIRPRTGGDSGLGSCGLRRPKNVSQSMTQRRTEAGHQKVRRGYMKDGQRKGQVIGCKCLAPECPLCPRETQSCK